MYIVESLKQLFPEFNEEIMNFDSFLRSYYPEDMLIKIYSTEKDNYSLIKEAFKHLQNNDRAKYNKYMAKYSCTLKNDEDFLKYFISSYLKDTINTSDWNLNQLKTYIEKSLNLTEAL